MGSSSELLGFPHNKDVHSGAIKQAYAAKLHFLRYRVLAFLSWVEFLSLVVSRHDIDMTPWIFGSDVSPVAVCLVFCAGPRLLLEFTPCRELILEKRNSRPEHLYMKIGEPVKLRSITQDY